MRKIIKKQEGITLIALVITIIVLLLLAGISISMLSGQDGIVSKAGEAKQASSEAEEYDKMVLAVQEALVNGYGKIDLVEGSTEENSLEKALEKVFGESKMPEYEEGKIKLSNGEKYIISENGSIELKTLRIGDEVTYKGEKFYVIGEGEVGTEVNKETQNDMLLLAKYNLKKENGNITLKQDTAVDGVDQNTNAYINACAFSSTAYWSTVSGIAYPDANGKYPDLNNDTKYLLGNATSIITIAKEYGESLGAEGRLMTLEEVKTLGVEEYSTSGCPTFVNGDGQGRINYWLGSASSGRNVWFVDGDSRGLYDITFDYELNCGVRPVIKISESLIK